MATSSRGALLVATLALLSCAPMGSSVPPRLTAQQLATAPLVTLGGERLDLAGVVRRHRATVLVWWASTCPCVKRYERRIGALHRDLSGASVAVFAVSSNADDDHGKLARVAAKRGHSVPLLLDQEQRLADALGVQTTPTTVVLDRRGRVVFHGWIDNERRPGEGGRQPYVERAVRAVLASKAVRTPRTPVYGCRITRSLGEVRRCRPAPRVKQAPCSHSH